MSDETTSAKAECPQEKSTSDQDPELAALRKPFTAQASMKAIERRKRRLAWSLVRAEWARRVEAVPAWLVWASAAVAVTVLWQSGMAARDLRFVAAQWLPVVGLAVGTALTILAGVVAVGKALTARQWKVRAVAVAVSALTLASVSWTVMAGADARALEGPHGGDRALVAQPFDIVLNASRSPEVFSVTIVGVVETPVSDEVVAGKWMTEPVARCWTLVGTIDKVQQAGWPWESPGKITGDVGRIGLLLDEGRIEILGLPSDEPLWLNDDACDEDPAWRDFASPLGDGPVTFALTFPLPSPDVPLGLEWIDSTGRTTEVTFGGYARCEASDGPMGPELTDRACWHVVTLEERKGEA